MVDLSGVTFMDSTGINALVAAHHRMPQDGELRVVGLRSNVQRVFEITGLDVLFTPDGRRRRPHEPRLTPSPPPFERLIDTDEPPYPGGHERPEGPGPQTVTADAGVEPFLAPDCASV